MALRIGAKFDEEEGFMIVRAVERGQVVAEWSLYPISLDWMMDVFSEIEQEIEDPGLHSGIEYPSGVLATELGKIDRCISAWADLEKKIEKAVDVFWLEEQEYKKPIGVAGFASMLYAATSYASRFPAGIMAPVCTDFAFGSWTPKGFAQAWKSPVFRQPGVIVEGPFAYARPALGAPRAANRPKVLEGEIPAKQREILRRMARGAIPELKRRALR